MPRALLFLHCIKIQLSSWLTLSYILPCTSNVKHRYVRVLRFQEKTDLIFAAVLLVQRVYRGHLGRSNCKLEALRNDTESRVAAVLRLQKAERGHQAWVRAKEERSTQQTNLFAQARAGNVKGVQDILAGYVVGEEEYNVNSVDKV